MKKVLVSALIIVFGVQFNLKAEEGSHSKEAATCTAESQKDCSSESTHKSENSSHEVGHGPATAAKDWSHKRQEQVSAIFPEKQKIAGKDIRPVKPTLTAPKSFSKVNGTTVTLTWEVAKGAENYHVQVSKDAGFNNRSMYVAEEKLFKGNSFEVKDLEPGVKYFWRVASVNPQQESQFTKSAFSVSSFETTSK